MWLDVFGQKKIVLPTGDFEKTELYVVVVLACYHLFHLLFFINLQDIVILMCKVLKVEQLSFEVLKTRFIVLKNKKCCEFVIFNSCNFK